MKNEKVAVLPVTKSSLFFKWLELTKPFHQLRGHQMTVLGWLLYYHYIYKNTINDENLVWKLVFDYDTKVKIKEIIGIQDASFQNVLTALRKKGAIKDNKIIPSYIPVISKNATDFKLIFHFKIKNDE